MSTASPLPVFIGGCPRSGTSWLQLILGELDGIATGPETHIVDIYAETMLAAYAKDAAIVGPDGIAGLIGLEEYTARIVVPAMRSLFDLHAARCGKCEFIVEKTPGNVRHPHLIDLAFPQSRFLEIVRDPRSVVASWKAVANEDWGIWARKSVFEVATYWNRAVLAGRQVDSRFGERHRLVKYEDLLDRPQSVCREIALWLGATQALDSIDAACASTALETFIDGEGTSDTFDPIVGGRSNFVRSGKKDSWRTELSLRELETIRMVCGEGMRWFGYTD